MSAAATDIELLELIRSLVQIPSVFPEEQRVGNFIEQLLQSAGFAVQRVQTGSDRFNLVATSAPLNTNPNRGYLGFYGHIDTVPADPRYTRPPFEVTQDGDTIRGLGVCDMKGGVACIIHAGIWARTNNIPVKLVFGVDEENISQGAHDLCASGALSDLRFMIVAESGQVVDFQQPISVCLGRKGRIVFQITVRGRAAHAAEAHKGRNAISDSCRLIDAIEKLNFAAHPRLGATSLVFQKITAASSAFSVPDLCTISVSALTSPGDDSHQIATKFGELTNQLGIDATIVAEPRPTPYGEAYELPLSDPFWKTLSTKVLAPLEVAPIYTPSVADENVFAARLKIPVLTIGPIGGGDHTSEEWASLRSLNRVVEVYQQAITLWQSGG